MIDKKALQKEQLELARKLVLVDRFEKIETIAGVDQAFIDTKIISAIVVCNKNLEVIEKEYAIIDTDMPYSPGYLSFREGPAIVAAFKKLKKKPDILLVECHGVLHKRLGLASYVGLALNQPTIGIAKKLLDGKAIDGLVYIKSEIRGYEFMTRPGSNPIYISPGHLISLQSCLDIIKETIKWPHKLPEPLALAHKYANKVKKNLIKDKE